MLKSDLNMAVFNWTYRFSDFLILPIFLVCSRLLFYRIYNRYFHPLSHIPGPFFGRMSPWPSTLHAWKGDRHLWLEHCFNKYGNKVRVAPDTVFFRSTTAYRDIYGNGANVRRADFYDALKREENQYSTITYMDNASHTKSRRLLDLAFTSRSLKASADFMQQHIDRWHELLTTDSGDDWTPPFNFTDRVNFLVFDILGDICYGNSFKTMEPGEKAFKAIPRAAVRLMTVLYAIAKSPFLHLYIYLRPRGLSGLFKAIQPKQIVAFDDFVDASIEQRIEREQRTGISSKARQDMFHFIYNAKDGETGEPAFRDERLVAECRLLVIAGSDSTSVTLSGLFFYLSRYTAVLDKLRREITNIFDTADEIVPGPKLSSCKYLKAAIDEAMRMSPPGLSELPRQVLPGGAEIDGEFHPENTIVGTAAWCDGFNDEVYGDAAVYRPERWLVGDTNPAEEVARIKANFHPFSIGPRNCAGTNFALEELMLVVAKTVHRFDFRLTSEWAKSAGLRHSRMIGGKEVAQFQLRDAYITVRDGPISQFRRRCD
jgi:cytochrome P450